MQQPRVNCPTCLGKGYIIISSQLLGPKYDTKHDCITCIPKYPFIYKTGWNRPIEYKKKAL